MKISIGMKLQSGPWGGGNQFAVALSAYLKQQGANVVHHLLDKDIDLILLTEPRKSSLSSAFTDRDIVEYLTCRNPEALVVHRINECDERKGTRDVNRLLIEANRCADHTVFIASWLQELFIRQGIGDKSRSVILNGADHSIFNAEGFIPWDHSSPLKIVTHHWGGNWLKGFDIYQELDAMLAEPAWKDRITFTYIGRTPEGFRFSNTNHIQPLSGRQLATELRKHHIYVTASRNEPAGMHHIEGAMCGMPLLFIESGALPEYCNGYGVSFTPEMFRQKLEEIIASYDHWAGTLSGYPNSAEKMCENYHALFSNLLARKNELLALREPLRPATLFMKSSYMLNHITRKIKYFRKSLQQER
ncbi:MAG: hypothetical protein RI826_07080 [Chlorobium phaeovibrioides]|nr:hypothetical protein [Chlorobium phaeovibrioides]